MKIKTHMFGHPIHPMLIPFPLGLLSTAAVFDSIGLLGGRKHWFSTAYRMTGAGIIGGIAAALFGIMDWWNIRGNTRAKKIGFWHGLGNALALTLFSSRLFLRRPSTVSPTKLAMACSYTGVALLAVTGWLGGELVDRLGIGVDQGAHPNAPSSLTEEPATATAEEYEHGHGHQAGWI